MKALNKETAPKTQRPERIIQFGEGNFLRAFVDWIIYNMNQKADFNSSVVVVQPNKDIGQIQKHQLLGIHTACFCFQIFRDFRQVFGYAFNDVTQRLCTLSLFFSRLRSLFLFCDTASLKRFSFSLTEVLPFRFSLP